MQLSDQTIYSYNMKYYYNSPSRLLISYPLKILKVNNTVSQNMNHENGIPLGSILSVILFTKIDEIFRLITRFHSSLDVDDLQIACRLTDLHISQGNLQDVLDRTVEWTCKYDCKCFQSKTTMVHFKSPRRHVATPSLCLG